MTTLLKLTADGPGHLTVEIDWEALAGYVVELTVEHRIDKMLDSPLWRALPETVREPMIVQLQERYWADMVAVLRRRREREWEAANLPQQHGVAAADARDTQTLHWIAHILADPKRADGSNPLRLVSEIELAVQETDRDTSVYPGEPPVLFDVPAS